MSAFVGRTREVDHLLSRLDRTVSGRGGIVFITGDAGAGKSTLVERFLVEAALRAPDAHILVGTCSEQYGSGEPYQPFIEAFRALVTEGRKDGASRGRFQEMAKRLAPFWLGVIPVAGNVLAAAVETAAEVQRQRQASTATDAPPSEEALFFQYTELLLAASEDAPVILFIDDLHWADRASVSLLGHLARKVADRSVLILGTYRSADVAVSRHPIREARAELLRYGLAEDLALETLGEAALADFIREELGGPGTPRLRRWLAGRAGANPLFFGELLRWLVEQGYCVEREGEWDLATIPDRIEIPASAEGVIEKRLGRLDPEVLKVLEYASVQGDEFDSTVLARLLDVDELELEEALERLTRVDQLLRLTETRDLPNGDLSSTYLFSHSLIQDVLDRGLQGKRRVLLHRKVAGILEEVYAGDTSSVDHVLAVHFEEGRQPERAYEAALRAAGRAGHIYAHEDAVALLGVALRNAPGEAERAETLSRRAGERQRAGRLSEALEDVDEALGLVSAADGSGIELRLRRQRVDLERECGLRPARELLVTLEELAGDARRSGDREELCELLWMLRLLPAVRTDEGPLPVDAALLEALGAAEALDRPDLVARAHYCLGTGTTQRLQPRRALEHLERAREGYERLGSRLNVGKCFNALAVAHVLLGDYEEARQDFVRAEGAFEEVGDPVSVAAVRSNLGILLTRLGAFEEAEKALVSALGTTRRLGVGGRELAPLQGLASLHSAEGRLDRAEERWSELAARAVRMGYSAHFVVATCELGQVALERGNLDAALAALDEAVGTYREVLEPGSDGREAVLRLRARLALAAGRTDEAARVAAEAEDAFEGQDEYVAATFRLLRAEATRGSREAAADLARRALATFERIGAARWKERAEELLSSLEEGG